MGAQGPRGPAGLAGGFGGLGPWAFVARVVWGGGLGGGPGCGGARGDLGHGLMPKFGKIFL